MAQLTLSMAQLKVSRAKQELSICALFTSYPSSNVNLWLDKVTQICPRMLKHASETHPSLPYPLEGHVAKPHAILVHFSPYFEHNRWRKFFKTSRATLLPVKFSSIFLQFAALLLQVVEISLHQFLKASLLLGAPFPFLIESHSGASRC